VLEELGKYNKKWDSLLVSTGIVVEIFGNPREKEDTPSSAERTTILSPESSSKRKEKRSRDQDSEKGKETAEPLVRKKTKSKGRKLQFTPEVVEILKPGKPLMMSAAKRLPIMDK
jgi:hypothetical protein